MTRLDVICGLCVRVRVRVWPCAMLGAVVMNLIKVISSP